jgi:hypothetical protein
VLVNINIITSGDVWTAWEAEEDRSVLPCSMRHLHTTHNFSDTNSLVFLNGSSYWQLMQLMLYGTVGTALPLQSKGRGDLWHWHL